MEIGRRQSLATSTTDRPPNGCGLIAEQRRSFMEPIMRSCGSPNWVDPGYLPKTVDNQRAFGRLLHARLLHREARCARAIRTLEAKASWGQLLPTSLLHSPTMLCRSIRPSSVGLTRWDSCVPPGAGIITLRGRDSSSSTSATGIFLIQ